MRIKGEKPALNTRNAFFLSDTSFIAMDNGLKLTIKIYRQKTTNMRIKATQLQDQPKKKKTQSDSSKIRVKVHHFVFPQSSSAGSRRVPSIQSIHMV